MRTLFQPGYFGFYLRKPTYIPSKTQLRAVTLHLINSAANPTNASGLSVNWLTRTARTAAATDQGTTVTDGSGNLILTGLTIPAGAGFVEYWSASDPLRARVVPVTFA